MRETEVFTPGTFIDYLLGVKSEKQDVVSVYHSSKEVKEGRSGRSR